MSSYHATCFRDGSGYCDIDPEYKNYWRNAFYNTVDTYLRTHNLDTTESLGWQIQSEIGNATNYFLTFEGPTLLFEHININRRVPTIFFQGNNEQLYGVVRELKEQTFIGNASDCTPVYHSSFVDQPESTSSNVRFEYGYHLLFNKGAALSRTLNSLSKKGYFQITDTVFMITAGSAINDSSMMTASMQYPFNQQTTEEFKPRLPLNVRLLFSILINTDEKDIDRPVVSLIDKFPSFKPVRVPTKGISIIMKTLAEKLQEVWQQ